MRRLWQTATNHFEEPNTPILKTSLQANQFVFRCFAVCINQLARRVQIQLQVGVIVRVLVLVLVWVSVTVGVEVGVGVRFDNPLCGVYWHGHPINCLPL